ncbi:MAG: Gfo/Idh/MocA family oxidoreductase [Pirellulaceae bacterium]
MLRQLTRREMLRNTGLAGVGVWVSGATSAVGWGGGKSPSPNEKLYILCVGVGGRGGADVNGVSTENIVALCDVDSRRAAKTFEKFPKAKRFQDYRTALEELEHRIDAVVIGTPDHTHAPPAAEAMRMGKHVYCEKPLTHCVYETRVLTELAREKKLATQLGTQIHARDNYRRVVELIQAGAIGPVRRVEVTFPGGLGGQDRPEETPPVPEGLNWDLWLGPAPYRPYHPAYVPGSWRAWWDFANGTLGDFGCHYMDLPYWALKLKYPSVIEAEGPPPHPETAAPVLTVRYQFPARGDLPPVTMTWRNGKGNKSPIFEEKKIPDWGASVLFVGEEGMLLANYSKHRLLPESKFADFQRPEPTIPKSIGHHQEWVRACKTGEPTTCNFDYSGPLTETVLLGNVSYRAGSALEWDAANLKATNCPEADTLIRREYREGWTL